MANQIEKCEGRIIISEKEFNRILNKKVIKNNSTSGKILVPKNLINKKVYVVWFEDEDE